MHCTYSLACSLNVDPDSIVVNILQKDMFPQDVDTEIRRGCYAICLQLARFVVQYFFKKQVTDLHQVYRLICSSTRQFKRAF